MSTKSSIKHYPDDQSGGWFHLYRECFDEEDEFVYLELGGVPFEAVNTVNLTEEKGPGSIRMRIPEDWARRLGLLPKAGA
jgi:hypothetical protein